MGQNPHFSSSPLHLPSIHHVSWATAPPPTPASPRLSPRPSLHLFPHCCPALSGCPISLACSLSITQSQWQPAPPPSAGPSPPPRLLDITYPHPPFGAIPTTDSGPLGPMLRENFHPHHPSPLLPAPEHRLHPVPGNVRIPQTFPWRLRKGGRGPGNGSTRSPFLSTGLHSLKHHPSPVCGYGRQL